MRQRRPGDIHGLRTNLLGAGADVRMPGPDPGGAWETVAGCTVVAVYAADTIGAAQEFRLMVRTAAGRLVADVRLNDVRLNDVRLSQAASEAGAEKAGGGRSPAAELAALSAQAELAERLQAARERG